MVANIMPTDPNPFTLGVKRSKFNLTMSSFTANLRKSRMQQHSSNYFACRPLPQDPVDGVNGSK